MTHQNSPYNQMPGNSPSPYAGNAPASPNYFAPYPPPNKDEQRLTAILERMERKIDALQAAVDALK